MDNNTETETKTDKNKNKFLSPVKINTIKIINTDSLMHKSLLFIIPPRTVVTSYHDADDSSSESSGF